MSKDSEEGPENRHLEFPQVFLILAEAGKLLR